MLILKLEVGIRAGPEMREKAGGARRVRKSRSPEKDLKQFYTSHYYAKLQLICLGCVPEQ